MWEGAGWDTFETEDFDDNVRVFVRFGMFGKDQCNLNEMKMAGRVSFEPLSLLLPLRYAILPLFLSFSSDPCSYNSSSSPGPNTQPL
jgi:hypothetical protein